MSNQLPNFLSGAMLVIKIDDGSGTAFPVLYATNLAFNQNMQTSGVQVIGAMANQSIEPLAYTASGSFTILSYVNSDKNDLGAGGVLSDISNKNQKISTASTTTNVVPQLGGQVATANSFLHKAQLMPRQMLLSASFDIEIQKNDATPIYSIYDCRLLDWSLAFSPGQLSSERVSFMARGVRVLTLNSDDLPAENLKGSDSGLAEAPTV